MNIFTIIYLLRVAGQLITHVRLVGCPSHIKMVLLSSLAMIFVFIIGFTDPVIVECGRRGAMWDDPKDMSYVDRVHDWFWDIGVYCWTYLDTPHNKGLLFYERGSPWSVEWMDGQWFYSENWSYIGPVEEPDGRIAHYYWFEFPGRVFKPTYSPHKAAIYYEWMYFSKGEGAYLGMEDNWRYKFKFYEYFDDYRKEGPRDGKRLPDIRPKSFFKSN